MLITLLKAMAIITIWGILWIERNIEVINEIYEKIPHENDLDAAIDWDCGND